MATITVRRDDAAQGNLPLVCMICGQQAAGYRLKRFRMGGAHVLRAPLCVQHGDHWRGRALLILCGSAAAVVLLLLGFSVIMTARYDSLTLLGGAVLLMAAVFLSVAMLVLYAALRYTSIRAIGADEHTITFVGVANGFVDAYQLERVRRNAGREGRPIPVLEEAIRGQLAQPPSDSVIAAPAPRREDGTVFPLRYQLGLDDYLAYYLFLWERRRRTRGLGCGTLTLIHCLAAPLAAAIIWGVFYFPIRGLFGVADLPLDPWFGVAQTGLIVFAYLFMSIALIRHKRSETGIQQDKKAYRRWLELVRLPRYSRDGLLHVGYSFEVQITPRGFIEISELRTADAKDGEVLHRQETRAGWTAVDAIDVTDRLVLISVGRHGMLIVPLTAFADAEAFRIFLYTIRDYHRAAMRAPEGVTVEDAIVSVDGSIKVIQTSANDTGLFR